MRGISLSRRPARPAADGSAAAAYAEQALGLTDLPLLSLLVSATVRLDLLELFGGELARRFAAL